MRIKPAEYQSVTWKPQPQTSGLWFSEGLTIFYADLLLRRAGLPVEDSTRTAHLESILEAFLFNPGYTRFSAEQISRAAYNSSPDALGDYTGGAHLYGEVLGTMLDLIVRDATNGMRSMDDVMRVMLERFEGKPGFRGTDVEHAVEDVCGCEVTPFFDAHVRAASPMDFDRYLALIGLRANVTWAPAPDREGRPGVDLRIWAYEQAADKSLRVRIGNPESVWGKAGLHTGDKLVSVNGTAVKTWPEFRAQLIKARIGDTMRIEVARPAQPFTASVVVSGYERPTVHIEPDGKATARVIGLRAAWLAGR
jgi:predicted metalloprotease with PDZ domain